MKVLFVSSGKSGGVNELVKNQGDSLIKIGVDVRYYTIQSGARGYVGSICALKRLLKGEKFDLIHAHYSLSAFAATLAVGKMPLVVSLLGSEAYKPFYHRWIIVLFHYCRWDKTIVKTYDMLKRLKVKNARVLPNGVDFERFKPISRDIARDIIEYPRTKTLILFVSDPARKEKNYSLACETFKLLGDENADLMPVFNVPNKDIPYYMNAADVLLLTSNREGSVNVIKEAMACNLPIVSTDVGDVRDNIMGVKGCYVCDSDSVSLAKGLMDAIAHNGSSGGRQRLAELNLDSQNVATIILNMYEDILKQ